MSRYFVGKPGQARARRGTDAVAVGFGLLLLVGAGLSYGEASSTDQWVLSLLEPLPTWFEDVCSSFRLVPTSSHQSKPNRTHEDRVDFGFAAAARS